MKFLIFLIIVGLGGYIYYSYHQAQLEKTTASIVSATNTSIDATVQSTLQGVAKVSPAYYIQNGRSYGASSAKNICYDTTSNTSLGSIIADIEQYTKAVSCVVDTDFPARSFTITAASHVHEGQYFCTDQSGYVGLIPSIRSGSTFKVGIKCK